ncbi:tetratricopeptide repeat protein [Acaryochloris sp. CCMEE 5410]|uniref:tetratricopeptide repeat protein n=1 Tax=Acaryochloris sp. CCMEE 5410 TaxID=310037 RepID=UPI0002483BB6|nr:tetratricopeptide repeat protein [Acaryochloris sp. CCMEE 5410]KAI9133509.1 tetratricopeptide repeat protein [Acaryochloris sp. CCMEE 5410]
MNIRKILHLFIHPWRIGAVAGIPLYADLTCLVAIALGSMYLARMSQAFHPDLGLAIGVIVGFALPLSIFIHEMSRALAAKHYQISVQGVYIRGLGSVAKTDQTFAHPLQMLEVYFAGTLVNFILYAGLNLLGNLSLNLGGTVIISLNHIKEFNFVLAMFSLVPLVPLNGGYIFRGLQWEWTRKQHPLAGHDVYGAYIAGGAAIALGLIWYGNRPFLGVWMLYLGLMTCLRYLLFEGEFLPLAMEQRSPRPFATATANISATAPRSPAPPARSTATKPAIRPLDFNYLNAEFLSVTEPDQQFQQGLDSTQEMRLQNAIASFNAILEKAPNNASALHNRGNAYLQLGKKQAALSDFQAALHLKTDVLEIYLGKGNAHFALGDFQGAIMEYSEILKRDPDHARAYFNRASAQVLNGNRQAAIADFKQAHTLFAAIADQTHTCKIDRRLQILTP